MAGSPELSGRLAFDGAEAAETARECRAGQGTLTSDL